MASFRSQQATDYPVTAFVPGEIVTVPCRYFADSPKSNGYGVAYVTSHGVYELPCSNGRGADGFLVGTVVSQLSPGSYTVDLDTNGTGARVDLSVSVMVGAESQKAAA